MDFINDIFKEGIALDIQLDLGIPQIKNEAIRAYTHTIAATHPKYKEWLLGNNIQVRLVLDSYEKNDLNYNFIAPDIYGGHPLLDTLEVNVSRFMKIADMSLFELIMGALRGGWHVVCTMDDYYIPNRYGYANQVGAKHLEMISGYREADDCFFIVGWNYRRAYDTQYISRADVLSAINGIFAKSNDTYSFFLNKTKSGVSYWLNAETLLKELKLYITSEKLTDNLFPYFGCTREKPNWRWTDAYRVYSRERYAYGISSNKYIAEYLRRNILNGFFEHNPLNAIHCIYEHKLCMLNRMRYLAEQGSIPLQYGEKLSDEYKRQVVDQAKIIENLYLKYAVTDNIDCLHKVCDIFEKLSYYEYSLTLDLIHLIEGSYIE